jgi:outer membrane protein OmpA-like peptidoglycan-associated protein
MTTMEASIRFTFNKSLITDSARTILDQKIVEFRANPALTIVVLGYTDLKGTDAYNMALGERRADAAKAYLVAKGIAETRVIVESRGERHQIPNSAGVQGEAPNRRAIFRLLITPDEIAKP